MDDTNNLKPEVEFVVHVSPHEDSDQDREVGFTAGSFIRLYVEKVTAIICCKIRGCWVGLTAHLEVSRVSIVTVNVATRVLQYKSICK